MSQEKKIDKPVILVDMDGTIIETELSVAQIMKDEHHIEVDLSEGKTLEEMGEKIASLNREILNRKGFFLNLKPIPGAIEALKEMDKIYSVRICTAPLRDSENCVNEKIKWVNNYLGPELARQMIVIKDKTLIRGDILIDDRKQTGLMVPQWKQLYYPQPPNLKFKGVDFLDSWSLWKVIIPKHLTSK